VEISDDRTGAFLVLDAGSGIVGLGETLVGEPRAVPILLTHYHPDHTQGLPFFSPLYKPGWVPAIWAPLLARVDQAGVDALFRPPFLPVPFEQLPSRPRVTLVQPGEIEVGGYRIGVQPLTHPGGAFAYRVHDNGKDLVYAPDHEFGDPDVDERLAAFALNAEAVILDAHFTPEELPQHKGWGHASWRQATDFASSCGAGHLWLFHHKPGRSDSDLSAIEAQARRVFPATSTAAEGRSFEL
jgi:phosphoribosyl 1,2-cyclic phosphodiesterase